MPFAISGAASEPQGRAYSLGWRLDAAIRGWIIMAAEAPSLVTDHPSGLAPVVERNIETLLRRRRQEEGRRGAQDRIADAISRFAGSMRFVYLHLLLYGAWVAVNLGWTPLRAFDPSFV